MPHFLLTFGHARQPVAGIVIIEAPSMDEARMTAVLRRFAPGVPFGEGLKLSAKLVASVRRNRSEGCCLAMKCRD